MDIDERTENGVTIFTLKGRVDTRGAVDLDLALQEAVMAEKYKMVLDMSGVRYISSVGRHPDQKSRA